MLEKLKNHLVFLGISKEDVMVTIEKPDEIVYDILTDRYVALSYAKNLAVVYEKENDRIIVVTAIYSSRLRNLVKRRRRMGRWI